MKLYKTEFTKSSIKELKSLPQTAQQKVEEILVLLSTNPFSELLQIKKLKGAENVYRVRFGNYRLIYEVRKNIITIIVIKIGHRKDVYG